MLPSQSERQENRIHEMTEGRQPNYKPAPSIQPPWGLEADTPVSPSRKPVKTLFVPPEPATWVRLQSFFVSLSAPPHRFLSNNFRRVYNYNTRPLAGPLGHQARHSGNCCLHSVLVYCVVDWLCPSLLCIAVLHGFPSVLTPVRTRSPFIASAHPTLCMPC